MDCFLWENKTKEEHDDSDVETLQPIQIWVTRGTRRIKISMHETMIIKGGIVAATVLMVIMRGGVIMMRAQD